MLALNNIGLAKCILKNGVDINNEIEVIIENKNYIITPLLVFLQYLSNDKENLMYNFLIENGADIKKFVNQKFVPDIVDVFNTPLLMATQNRNIKLMKSLIDFGADKEFKNKGGMTPLMYAVKYYVHNPNQENICLEMITLLLNSKPSADINTTNLQSQNLLMHLYDTLERNHKLDIKIETIAKILAH